MNKTITLSEQEANALIQLIDTAVKTLGLSGAEAGLVLNKKIQDAFRATAEVNKEVKK